jgi:hypothetical protein
MLKYLKLYYSNAFGPMLDRMKENRQYNRLYKTIQQANRRFLATGKRHYVLPDPTGKRFFAATNDEIKRLQIRGVFVRRMDIYLILRLAVYSTPERLNQETITEVKATNYEKVINGILKKFKF